MQSLKHFSLLSVFFLITLKVLASDYTLQPGTAVQVGNDRIICSGSSLAKGHCEAHNPNDQSAVGVCNSQFKNQQGCSAQSYFCHWISGGSCVARNPSDAAAVRVCNTQANNESGCRAQSYFCQWTE